MRVRATEICISLQRPYHGSASLWPVTKAETRFYRCQVSNGFLVNEVLLQQVSFRVILSSLSVLLQRNSRLIITFRATLYQKDKRVKPKDLPKIDTVSAIDEHEERQISLSQFKLFSKILCFGHFFLSAR